MSDVDDRWLICNPESGDGTHAPRVRSLAADRGIRVRETEGEGDAATFAEQAVANGVSELAVCGGDGTVKEVLSGLEAAGVLRAHIPDKPVSEPGPEPVSNTNTDADIDPAENGDEPPIVSVIPAGTANVFAGDMGIAGIDEGFSVLEGGEVRRLDVGIANGEPFMKSAIAGLTADASSATSDDLKERLGPLAFLVTGIQRAREFDPISIAIDADGENGEWAWSGEALCLVIGNARKYAGGVGQADVEDGLFDVTLVEEMPTANVVAEGLVRQLLERETDDVSRIKAGRIAVQKSGDEPIEWSLDGEVTTRDRLTATVRRRAVPVRVGPTYDAAPDGS